MILTVPRHTLFPTRESKPLRNDDFINLFGHYQA